MDGAGTKRLNEGREYSKEGGKKAAREEKQNITTLVAQHDVEKWKFMHYAYSFTAALSSKLLHKGGGYTFIISIFLWSLCKQKGSILSPCTKYPAASGAHGCRILMHEFYATLLQFRQNISEFWLNVSPPPPPTSTH